MIIYDLVHVVADFWALSTWGMHQVSTGSPRGLLGLRRDRAGTGEWHLWVLQVRSRISGTWDPGRMCIRLFGPTMSNMTNDRGNAWNWTDLERRYLDTCYFPSPVQIHSDVRVDQSWRLILAIRCVLITVAAHVSSSGTCEIFSTMYLYPLHFFTPSAGKPSHLKIPKALHEQWDFLHRIQVEEGTAQLVEEQQH